MLPVTKIGTQTPIFIGEDMGIRLLFSQQVKRGQILKYNIYDPSLFFSPEY